VNIIVKDKGLNIMLNKIDYNTNECKYIFISKKPEETIYIGTKLGNLLLDGDLIAINGDLGAGKTCLIKGIALGLKSMENISSPSFSIINEYTGRSPIFHFDLYRLNKQEEIEELGYEEYFFDEGVTLIEWAHKIKHYLPEKLLLIDIIMDYNNILTRKIFFEPRGERYKKIMEDLKAIEYIGN
jgi:tRNA threonylcarbamoyladenosine biosynthesis protein TsaE